ncbi:hypothetical protein Tco_1150890 [Tanacetum coccineum]
MGCPHESVSIAHQGSKQIDRPGHKTETVSQTPEVSRHKKPSLDRSLPKLYGVTEKLDTPIVAANLRIAFVFEDCDDFTESPLFRHLRDSEDLVEEAS